MPTENQGLAIIDGVIDALMAGGEKAAELYLTGLAPEVMAMPIVGWLISEGMVYLSHIIARTEEKFVNNIVIDIQVNGERSAVITQAVALQIALSSGDIDAIKSQADKAAEAWGSLIRYDGSHVPK